MIGDSDSFMAKTSRQSDDVGRITAGIFGRELRVDMQLHALLRGIIPAFFRTLKLLDADHGSLKILFKTIVIADAYTDLNKGSGKFS